MSKPQRKDGADIDIVSSDKHTASNGWRKMGYNQSNEDWKTFLPGVDEVEEILIDHFGILSNKIRRRECAELIVKRIGKEK